MKPTNFKQTCKYNEIMTSKEKAEELYVEYWYLTNNSRIAKQCALIAVDEIRDNLPLISEIQQYWIDVKTELTNL